MSTYTVTLSEVSNEWLKHISDRTNKPIEELIADGIENYIIAIEDRIFSDFFATEGLI